MQRLTVVRPARRGLLITKAVILLARPTVPVTEHAVVIVPARPALLVTDGSGVVVWLPAVVIRPVAAGGRPAAARHCAVSADPVRRFTVSTARPGITLSRGPETAVRTDSVAWLAGIAAALTLPAAVSSALWPAGSAGAVRVARAATTG